MTSASESRCALCRSLITRPSSSSLPPCVSTTSVGLARPFSSSDAATNGLSVEAGSNGSVTAVLEKIGRPTLLLARARSARGGGVGGDTLSPPLPFFSPGGGNYLPGVRVHDDDVAAIGVQAVD